MKIEKKVLTEVLRVLGKVVSQTAPEEVRRRMRFLGCGDTVTAMATDGKLRLNCKKKKSRQNGGIILFGGR